MNLNLTYTCPRCDRTSNNPNDVLNGGYCGACHDWTAQLDGTRTEHLAAAKVRAMQQLTSGGPSYLAVSSLLSDLRKHPDLADHPGIELAASDIDGCLRDPARVLALIDGFR